VAEAAAKALRLLLLIHDPPTWPNLYYPGPLEWASAEAAAKAPRLLLLIRTMRVA
jgi:hypothetical protein